MKQINTFLKDFISHFLSIALELLIVVVNIISQTITTIIKFIKNIIVPNILYLLSDFYFISLILYQSFLSFISNICLYISKFFLSISKLTHNKSEELLHKNWDVN